MTESAINTPALFEGLDPYVDFSCPSIHHLMRLVHSNRPECKDYSNWQSAGKNHKYKSVTVSKYK
ncbi:MAG: hypothetical protein M3Y25_09260 [Thermoproteota archaeon]|nr:hypothetical protein [Thermoproteota archaeon]